MFLFFNTQTTGFPANYNAPITEGENWPRMVQLAYSLYTAEGKKLDQKDYIIKPEGYIIPEDAAEIHGITTERAMEEGADLLKVLTEFQQLSFRCTHLIAHNISYNEKILGAEYFRKLGRNPLSVLSKHCTMKNPDVITFCGLPPFAYGTYKWPTLSELHHKLFNDEYKETHNAAIDLEEAVKCFFELLKRGVI
jgi:DNA polymerase III epsilon subunit-like protein